MLQRAYHGSRRGTLDENLGVCHGARILVVLVEGLSPQVMDAETEYDHLEGISLLSAGLSPGIEHVIAVIEVTQSTAGEMRSTAGEISPFIEWFTPQAPTMTNTRALGPGMIII